MVSGIRGCARADAYAEAMSKSPDAVYLAVKGMLDRPDSDLLFHDTREAAQRDFHRACACQTLTLSLSFLDRAQMLRRCAVYYQS
jgi:hypothetical protein